MTIRSKGISGVKVLAALSAGMGLLAAAGAASAQDSTWGSGGPGTRTGIYLEAGPSYMNFKGDDGVEADTWGATARAGWQILPMFSLEADATFGFEDGDFDYRTSEGDLSIDDNSDGDVADVLSAPGEFGLNYMFGAYGRLSFPVTPQWNAFVRAGYAYADVDSTITTPGGTRFTLGDSEDGPSYGAGTSWNFNDNSAIRADYTYTDFDLAEVDAFSVTYQFKF